MVLYFWLMNTSLKGRNVLLADNNGFVFFCFFSLFFQVFGQEHLIVFFMHDLKKKLNNFWVLFVIAELL